MKSLILLLICFTSLCGIAREYEYNYSFFTNSPMPGHWFFSKVDSSGGSYIIDEKGKIPVSSEIYHTPGNSLELNFRNSDHGHWSAEIYHQELRGADHFKKPEYLSFWIYVASERLTDSEMPSVQIITNHNYWSDVIPVRISPSNGWQQIIIPLERFGALYDFFSDHVKTVRFSQQDGSSGGPFQIFVDDIEMLPGNEMASQSQLPVITSAHGFAMHIDLAWEKITDPAVHLVKIYRSEGAGPYVPVGVQQPYLNRFADFTGETEKTYSYRIAFLNSVYEESEMSLPVEASTWIMTDDELLTMVQEACFRYYWEGCEPNSGLARENIPGRHQMVATGASGFGIMTLIAGTERRFISRDESVDRFLKILAFLEKADRFHGVFGHFMDGVTGKVEPFFGNRDNGADLVETAFLMQGLLVARQYFSGENENEKLIREKITKIWEDVEWDWFRKEPESNFLYWHWSPDQAWVINHPLIGWNETMIVYLLAIASPTYPVPPEMYYTGWAGQDKTAQKYRKNWGGSEQGSLYANGDNYFGIKLDVGVNNGGPLFFTHYSYMGCDPHLLTDKYTNYFKNNQAIARINYNYCLANPNHYKGYGEGGWGLTASDGPYDYSADEPIPSRDLGKLAPTGAISSFPYTPEESMNALKNYYYNCGQFLWGEYGFKDAFNLTENWCSEIYMGLNQAPIVVMIENYRTGLIWKLFMLDQDIRKGLRKLEEEGLK